MFFILELTVIYKTNLRNIIKRKQDWYMDFIKKQNKRNVILNPSIYYSFY